MKTSSPIEKICSVVDNRGESEFETSENIFSQSLSEPNKNSKTVNKKSGNSSLASNFLSDDEQNDSFKFLLTNY